MANLCTYSTFVCMRGCEQEKHYGACDRILLYIYMCEIWLKIPLLFSCVYVLILSCYSCRNCKKGKRRLKCLRNSTLKIPCFSAYVELYSLTIKDLSGVDLTRWFSIRILAIQVPFMLPLRRL